jgi:hypothetical protein
MRKKGENNVKCAGKSAIPPDENNDFTPGVESQTFPPPPPSLPHRDCSVAHLICHNLPVCAGAISD